MSITTILLLYMYVVLQREALSDPEEVVPVPSYTPDPAIPTEIQSLAGSHWLLHPVLKRALSVSLHDEYLNLLRDFVQLVKERDVDVVIVDGTLLGSYFFHDILPWDDDI